jgi:hypothetical protein
MRDVAGGGKDHYYLLKDLYSVAGLAASNGRLEEAYVYDTYGEAVIEGRTVGQGPDDGGRPKGDLNRDGVIDDTDEHFIWVRFSIFDGEIIPKTHGFRKNIQSHGRPRVAVYSFPHRRIRDNPPMAGHKWTSVHIWDGQAQTGIKTDNWVATQYAFADFDLDGDGFLTRGIILLTCER